jgi:cell wall-associated NlpC family hydrolase
MKQRSIRLLALLPILALFLSFGCAWKSGSVKGSPGDSSASPQSRAILDTARTTIGVPYRYGGATPKTGFDCSGLTNWVFARHGIRLPRVSWEQLKAGQAIQWGRLSPADLVFFRTSQQGKSLHVGIYSGKGMFIHSPKTSGHVREEAMRSPYWRNRFIEGRRLLR